MEHLEIHIINSTEDSEMARVAGLLDDLSTLDCDNCEEPVGTYNGVFYSYAVVLNEDDESWITCEECFTPVVYPARFEYTTEDDD